MTTRELLNTILHNFSDMDYVHPEDIPNIDLYMDQLTTFLDENLGEYKRNPEDKTITKTMINNYTKSHVLPAPEKKKYSKDHLLNLIFIYYFKSFLSIKDISELMTPMTERYFGKDAEISFANVYEELVTMENSRAKNLMGDIMKEYNIASNSFADAPEEDREQLQKFAFFCLMSFDIYVRKMMLEEMIDLEAAERTAAEERAKAEKEEATKAEKEEKARTEKEEKAKAEKAKSGKQ